MASNGINRFIQKAKNYENDPKIQKEILKNTVTANLIELMKEKDIKKADLARLMNTSAANITQILNGSRNFTIEKLCEIAIALDSKIEIILKDKKELTEFKYYLFDTVYIGNGEKRDDGVSYDDDFGTQAYA
jgi:transcriptional regulator with XRE-family HTH domain